LFFSGLVALLVPLYLGSLVHLPSQGRAVWSAIIWESLILQLSQLSTKDKTCFGFNYLVALSFSEFPGYFKKLNLLYFEKQIYLQFTLWGKILSAGVYFTGL